MVARKWTWKGTADETDQSESESTALKCESKSFQPEFEFTSAKFDSSVARKHFHLSLYFILFFKVCSNFAVSDIGYASTWRHRSVCKHDIQPIREDFDKRKSYQLKGYSDLCESKKTPF